MATSAGSIVLAERYARALLDVVLDKIEGDDALDKVAAELDSMAGLLKENPRLAHSLALPTIPADKRVSVLDSILERAEFAAPTVNVLRLLTERERMGILPLVCEQFRRLVLEHRKVQPGEVTSAIELSEEQRRRLAESLGRALSKSMALTYRTDGELVGGLVVRIGNRVYDASVLAQLARLKEQALSTG